MGFELTRSNWDRNWYISEVGMWHLMLHYLEPESELQSVLIKASIKIYDRLVPDNGAVVCGEVITLNSDFIAHHQ